MKLEINMENMVKVIMNLEEKIPKGDDVAQGTHENKDSVHVSNKPLLIIIIKEDLILIVKIIMDGFLSVFTFPRSI